jgi:hypothetical protein
MQMRKIDTILFSECPAGRFGQNCNVFCANRHCLNNEKTCRDKTGACSGGCAAGYFGPTCIKGKYCCIFKTLLMIRP